MVCPLRFVLAGLSAAIVLFLAVDMLWLQSKDDVYQGLEEIAESAGAQLLRLWILKWDRAIAALGNTDEDEVPDTKDSPNAKQRRSKLPMPKSILDCFTGRYLYQVYGLWRQEATRQHNMAQQQEAHNS